MFHYKSESHEKGRYYIVTTKNICVQMKNGFVLRNKKTVIDKRND